jgi:RNA polymerase sigma-70 factor, ECF subfamily
MPTRAFPRWIFAPEPPKVTRQPPKKRYGNKFSSAHRTVTFSRSPANTFGWACLNLREPQARIRLQEYSQLDKDYSAARPLMHPDSELERLMARYQTGDFAAATALIHRVSPQLHRFFLAQFASRSDADDLLQETWLRIHKVRHTYRPSEPLLPWAYAIARHVRVDHYRKSLRASAREHRLEEISSIPLTSNPASAPPTDELAELLAPLSESQRELLAMLKVAGMSLEEVARATSSTVGSVKQKVHRAYKKLREELGSLNLKKGGRKEQP